MPKEFESRGLVPISLDTILEKEAKPDLSNLSHLQRLSGLVFIYMQASSRLFEQGNAWLKTSRGDLSLEDLLKTPQFANSWPISETHDRKKFPEFMTNKLFGLGNPFGFSKEATQAALEMAEELSGNQMFVDELRMGPHDPEWKADQMDYFQSTILDMYYSGHNVGNGGLSQSNFPAYLYWSELFPDEVGLQIEKFEHEMQDFREDYENE